MFERFDECWSCVDVWPCLLEMFCRTSCSVNVEHQCVLIECVLTTTSWHVCKHVWEVWWVSCVYVFQIVAYICLRNIHNSLQAKYSVFFAWFGRISLEVGSIFLLRDVVCSLVLLWMVVSLAKGVVTLTDNAWESLLARILSLFQKNSYFADGDASVLLLLLLPRVGPGAVSKWVNVSVK